ncbi:hypothetical protein JXQ70_09130 [bacterium]|nr:hypothetical protein [bacterium]
MKYSPFRYILVLGLIGLCSMLCLSCLVFDDDDDDDDDDLERIIYHNNTPYYVDNYIDDHYVGTVQAYESLTITGWRYEGRHLYFSESIDNDWEWGPDYFFIDDGGTLNISLDPPY